MSAASLEIKLADGDQIFVGSKKAITATVLDADDVAATPTQFKLTFTPDAAPASATTYAKTPVSPEVAFTSETSNTFTANHLFNVAGWWTVVGIGSGNMAEVEKVRIFVDAV